MADPEPFDATKVSVDIDVRLYRALHARAAGREGGVGRLVEDLLQKVFHLDPADRWFPISPAVRVELEAILQSLPFGTEKDLLEKVRTMSSIRIGELILYPSQAQLLELRRRAEINKRPVEEDLAEQFKAAADFIFGIK